VSSGNGGPPGARRTPHDADPWGTLAGFMRDRSDWLRIDVAQNGWGSYDVVLRLDGSYVSEGDAHAALRLFRREFARIARREGLRLEDWHAPDPARPVKPQRRRRAS
jgi:hypothetical protein